MITNTRMCWGDKMCAQLNHLAELLYICRENNQQLVLLKELKDFRTGFRFSDAFDVDFVEYVERSGAIKKAVINIYCKMSNRKTWQQKTKRSGNKGIYLFMDLALHKWIRKSYPDFIQIRGYKDDVHTDKRLLNLDSNKNYDISGGHGTYQDWQKYETIIRQGIRFKPEIAEAGDIAFRELDPDKKKISLHIRRTDYLVVGLALLDDSYYKKAMECFAEENVQFLVFSDDIEYCKTMDLFKGADVIFMERRPGPVDLYLMTLCDGNIIANSTFSFWGAFLNKKKDKKVVCPKRFVGDDLTDFTYINGNYYPNDWIAI